LQLDVTFDDPKTFTRPFTLHMTKTYSADTEILEDVCENERDSGHLTTGVKVPAQMLASYAGAYALPGRQAVVSVSGDQLIIKDSASPKDQLFVARSETEFLSSVSEVTIAFNKNPDGSVASFTRTAPGGAETGTRVTGGAGR
jgi:hypothetical protein